MHLHTEREALLPALAMTGPSTTGQHPTEPHRTEPYATETADLAIIDASEVDWHRVGAVTFVVRHGFRYEYPEPIRDLRHRLVVVPPERLGDQRRLMHRLDVSHPHARAREVLDSFGNTVAEIDIDEVDGSVDFEVWAVAERCVDCGPTVLPVAALCDPRYLQHSRLTGADEAIRAAAAELSSTGATGLDLAELITGWVHDQFTYEHGTTTVATTAAQALNIGRGVCQDYAHVMLAVARACGMPARYVSGHLIGEGGTHAWVEVIVPGDEHDRPGTALAVPFDPTHRRRGRLSYLTVAVGADYRDVPPTSGSYRSAVPGRLSTRRRLSLTGVRYA